MTSPDCPLIGLVTVLYNCDEVLPGFFDSLSRQEGVRYRLYVIDNSATDSGARISEELARRHGIDVRVVFNNFNRGVARGNNQGIEMALADGCELILLGNNDTEFGTGTLVDLVCALRREKVAAVTPKIYYHDTDRLIWYAGGSIDAWLMRTPHWGKMEKDVGQHDRGMAVSYGPTCFMLIEASVFRQIGWMDEQYFCYYDDTDFVWRMTQAGLRLYYEPSCLVQHKVSTSTGGDESPFSLRYMNRNRAYFIRKNLRGMQRGVALAYMTLTRIPHLFRLEKKLAGFLWSGFREGLRLSTTASGRNKTCGD